MPVSTNQLPQRRPELLIGPLGEPDTYGVSDPASGDWFQIGSHEAFLLSQLNGIHNSLEIRRAFQDRFGVALAENDLWDFVDIANDQGFCLSDNFCRSDGDSLACLNKEYRTKYDQSGRIFTRSQNVIAGATSHDRRDFGPFPIYIKRAEGPYKWDVSGNRFIDFWMGHGALFFGHHFPPVVEAVQRQIANGTHYGACHELEVSWAEKVCELIPSAEKVRFTASGTEATLLAFRIARAFTGKPRVVKFHGHFHGWHDEVMAHNYPAKGAGFNPHCVNTVAMVESFSLEDTANQLQQGDVAAVILEPGGGSSGGFPWSVEWLEALRELTQKHQSLLIFDEVISGFRQSPGGVQKLTGVTPDITTLAKILCGGLPGGAVVGRSEFMSVFGTGIRLPDRWVQVPHTGTFNGNPLSAVAGLAMLQHVDDGEAQATASRAAQTLADGVNQAADEHGVDVYLYTNESSVFHILIGAKATGLPLGPSSAVATLQSSHPERYALLRRALLVEGIDSHQIHGWVSAVHDAKVVDDAVAAFARAFGRLKHLRCFRAKASNAVYGGGPTHGD